MRELKSLTYIENTLEVLKMETLKYCVVYTHKVCYTLCSSLGRFETIELSNEMHDVIQCKVESFIEFCM